MAMRQRPKRKCPRKYSDMTPCVVEDGPVAYAIDWLDRPICVGCECLPETTGVKPGAAFMKMLEERKRKLRR